MTEKEDQLVGKDKSHPEELLLFMSLPTIKHPEGLVVRNQLPKSYHCPGLHALWQCKSFRSAPYEERL